MSEIKIFADPDELAKFYATDFQNRLTSQWADRNDICVALSGGSTPKRLFQTWASLDSADFDWNRFHFFWGDERCVPPDHTDSNYGVAHQLMLRHIDISAERIHRVEGELDPETACSRYEQTIREIVPSNNGLPQFDVVIQGLGDDGHTASIFPHQMELLESDSICAVATHPVSGQFRVTLTGPVIRNARQIDFLVTGANKAEVVGPIISQTEGSRPYPAAHFHSARTTFYLDQAAGSQLPAENA